MTKAEIIALLVENDSKAIRAIINFIDGQTDQKFIQQWKETQDELRKQLKEVDAPIN